MSGQQKSPSSTSSLGGPVQAHLGQKLREFYGSILSEPVPDKLTALLDQLEHQERSASEKKPKDDEK